MQTLSQINYPGPSRYQIGLTLFPYPHWLLQNRLPQMEGDSPPLDPKIEALAETSGIAQPEKPKKALTLRTFLVTNFTFIQLHVLYFIFLGFTGSLALYFNENRKYPYIDCLYQGFSGKHNFSRSQYWIFHVSIAYHHPNIHQLFCTFFITILDLHHNRKLFLPPVPHPFFVSACTSGFTVLNVANLKISSQVILYILMLTGAQVTLSVVPVFIRKKFFRKNIIERYHDFAIANQLLEHELIEVCMCTSTLYTLQWIILLFKGLYN